MTEQQSLFAGTSRRFDEPKSPRQGLSAARAQAEAAIRKVEEAADQKWLAQALEAVRQTALKHATFISDDVWDAGLPSTGEDRALGSVMRRAARAGWCQRTNETRPSRRSHGSGKPVWRSLIFSGKGRA